MLQNYGLFFILTVAIWWQFVSKSRIQLVFLRNNTYICTMKTRLNPQHPMVLNSEKIKDDGVAVLRNVTMLPTGGEPFVAPDYVISIGHRGRMDLMYEDMRDISAPRVFAIIFPNHKIRCVNQTADFKTSLIVVDAKMIDDPLLQIIRQCQYRYESRPSVELGEREYKVLMKMVDVMQETASLDIPDKRLLMLRLLESFLRMLGHYRQRILDDVKAGEKLSSQFLGAIIKHYRQHRDVSFYADLFCLTPKYFSNVIRQQTGHTAAYWIRQHVIAEAQTLLHDRPDLTIQVIAGLLGFDEQQIFSRYFKRDTGVSPTEFRACAQQ